MTQVVTVYKILFVSTVVTRMHPVWTLYASATVCCKKFEWIPAAGHVWKLQNARKEELIHHDMRVLYL